MIPGSSENRIINSPRHIGILTLPILYQIHQELDREIGKNPVEISLDLRAKCPYVEATIMETQRFATIAPVALIHTPVTDCEYRGYRIPKDTEVRFE